jgi:hypothetical protein
VELARAGIDSCPSYPSALRYLKFHGLLRRQPPRRSAERPWEVVVGLQEREIRSYEVEYVLQLMHLDFHHGSRKVLTREGRWVKPLLVSFIDDRSRFLCHAQWYTNERTEDLVHGLCQALQKVGLPRSIMSVARFSCSSDKLASPSNMCHCVLRSCSYLTSTSSALVS